MRLAGKTALITGGLSLMVVRPELRSARRFSGQPEFSAGAMRIPVFGRGSHGLASTHELLRGCKPPLSTKAECISVRFYLEKFNDPSIYLSLYRPA